MLPEANATGRQSRLSSPIRVLQVCAFGMILRQKMRPVIDALAEEGYEVESACVMDSDAEWMADNGYVVHEVNIPRSIKRPLQSLSAVSRLKQIVRHGEFTIVHSHAPTGGLHANFVARRAGAEFVFYTLRGLYYHQGLSLPVRELMAWGHAAVMRRADMVFVVAAHLKQEVLRRRAGSEENVVVLNGTGLEVEAFSAYPEQREQVRQQVRQRLGIVPEAKVAVIVSRAVWDKGLEELIRAGARLARSMPELRVIIAGWGPATQQAQQLINDLGAEEHILNIGRVDPADLPALLWACDLFVFPSYHEGFPVAPLEAMAAGLPVVASDIPGCREQISEGYNGFLVPVRSVEPLAQAIGRVLGDDSLRATMSANALEVVRQYDIRITVDQYLEAYRRFLAVEGLL